MKAHIFVKFSKKKWYFQSLFLVLSSSVLASCALPVKVDSTTQSFGTAHLVPQTAQYQWDMLPSQQNNKRWQVTLEKDIVPILAQHGLTLYQAGDKLAAKANNMAGNEPKKIAPYAIQIVFYKSKGNNPLASMQSTMRSPFMGISQLPIMFGGCAWGAGGSMGFGNDLDCFFPPDTWWKVAMDLLLRDTLTQKIVYETHAQINGPWENTYALIPALLESALKNYPRIENKTHEVSIAIKMKPEF